MGAGKINRKGWLLNGNEGTDSTNFLGTLDLQPLFVGSQGLDQSVNISVNSTFGGQRTVATWEPNNVAAGGPAFDMRPGEAVFLPDFVLMKQTIRLVTSESAFGTSLSWRLNNDSGAQLRIFSFAVDDGAPGDFGDFAFALGSLSSGFDNILNTNGLFDFTFNSTGLDQAINFDVNDGGSTLRALRIDANDVTLGQPKVSFEGYTQFASSGVDFVNNQGVMQITPLIDDIPGGLPVAIGANISPIFEYTGGIAGFGSGLRALSVAPEFRPASGLGVGTDSTPMIGALVASIWNGNGTGRTATTVQGFTLQAAVRDGTVTNLVGMQSQAGTVLGGSFATNAISIRANAPFEFLGGVIDFGTSFISVGGTAANTNVNARFTNDVPCIFEGSTSFGKITAPNAVIDVEGDSLFNGALEHTGTTFGLYSTTPVVQSAAYTPTNVTPDRTYNANVTSVNELADVVGTLIADLQLTGIIG